MGTFITSGAAAYKAGLNVSSSVPELAWTTWISGAESFINSETMYNWSDAYATLNNDVKFVLDEVCAALVANCAISYDMSGYTSRSEAQTMLDVNRDIVVRGMKFLEDRKNQTFITGA